MPLFFANKIYAVTVSVEVSDGRGGQIVMAPNDVACKSDCLNYSASGDLISLFAVPVDESHRFQGWAGACADVLGPLCTLKPSQDIEVSAHFAGNSSPEPHPVKAILLLHGTQQINTVWNEFVSRHFNSRCPIVYGGVVLSEDAVNPMNNVLCYRIAFGYYAMLERSEIPKQSLDIETKDQPALSSSNPYLTYEIEAAVLGLLNRHPKLSLVLLGPDEIILPAQAFFKTETAKRSATLGLLTLSSSDLTAVQLETFQDRETTLLNVKAEPEQTGKIHAGLARLTESWWLTK